MCVEVSVWLGWSGCRLKPATRIPLQPSHNNHDNAPSHNATIIKQFLAQRKVTVLDYPSYSPHLAPADYCLFPKVKSHLKGRLFDWISDIQTTVTSTLNTIAKDEFYKGTQTLYGRANLCVQLQGICVEN